MLLCLSDLVPPGGSPRSYSSVFLLIINISTASANKKPNSVRSCEILSICTCVPINPLKAVQEPKQLQGPGPSPPDDHAQLVGGDDVFHGGRRPNIFNILTKCPKWINPGDSTDLKLSSFRKNVPYRNEQAPPPESQKKSHLLLVFSYLFNFDFSPKNDF